MYIVSKFEIQKILIRIFFREKLSLKVRKYQNQQYFKMQKGKNRSAKTINIHRKDSLSFLRSFCGSMCLDINVL